MSKKPKRVLSDEDIVAIESAYTGGMSRNEIITKFDINSNILGALLRSSAKNGTITFRKSPKGTYKPKREKRYSDEFKQNVILECEAGTSFDIILKQFGITRPTLLSWIDLYGSIEVKALVDRKQSYPDALKEMVIADWLKGDSLQIDLSTKYKVKISTIHTWIRSYRQINKVAGSWVKRSKEEWSTIISEYDNRTVDKATVAQICQKYNISPAALYNQLNKYTD